MQNKKFLIYHFYKDELDLYGDSGNILYLQYFLNQFNIESKVEYINSKTKKIEECDFIFAGGGPDLLQNKIYSDFLSKKDFITTHINKGKPALFVCGSFQLLGKYYKTSEGKKIPGLKIFDFYTYSPKNQSNRIIGNIWGLLNIEQSFFSNKVVGFENHNGRTMLKSNIASFSQVSNLSFGNNDKDFTEGLLFKKTIGTYLHGPLLVKNPHVLFFLLSDYIKNKNIDLKMFTSEYVAFNNALLKKR